MSCYRQPASYDCIVSGLTKVTLAESEQVRLNGRPGQGVRIARVIPHHFSPSASMERSAWKVQEATHELLVVALGVVEAVLEDGEVAFEDRWAWGNGRRQRRLRRARRRAAAPHDR